MAPPKTSLFNAQKPYHLNQHFPPLNRPASRAKLEAELGRLLTAAAPITGNAKEPRAESAKGKLALFLEKEITFIFSKATEELNTKLKEIFRRRPTDKLPTLSPDQIRVLQDISYLGRLDRELCKHSLPSLYHNPSLLTQEINQLLPRKNSQLRKAAHERITRRIIERYLNENCAWLRNQEKRLQASLQRALNQLFFQCFEIENENPKYLDNTVRYALPVLEQLAPFLQKITDLAQQGLVLANTAKQITASGNSAARPNPLPRGARPVLAANSRRATRLATISANAPLNATAGIHHTVDTYARIYVELLQKPVTDLFKGQTQKEKRQLEAEIAHLPYHPHLHSPIEEHQ